MNSIDIIRLNHFFQLDRSFLPVANKYPAFSVLLAHYRQKLNESLTYPFWDDNDDPAGLPYPDYQHYDQEFTFEKGDYYKMTWGVLKAKQVIQKYGIKSKSFSISDLIGSDRICAE